MASVRRGDFSQAPGLREEAEAKNQGSLSPVFHSVFPMTRSGSRGKAPARLDAAGGAPSDRRENVLLLENVSTETTEPPDKNNLGRK